jgi:methionyl-tRNA synthetase
MARQYITTAIDYPNAAPHMGHVLEKVLADTAARWFRLRGDEVRFQIGTDEHGVKIQNTAEKEGVQPQELVDRNVPLFQNLYDELRISYDYFIRTSDINIHWPTVIALWKRLQDAGMLKKKRYTGLYCSGCERFMAKRDLTDGKCPNHRSAPQEVTEENWFFLLSRDDKNLHSLLTKNWNGESYRIVPDFRAQETLSLIAQGLDDVSFSRPKTSLSWGIPVPGDAEQTMYVWCDALTNYISGLGYFTDHEDRTFWDAAHVTHVIGKDIARFHALYWPAMLKHTGVKTPDTLLIHGFLTSKGDKMSKSLGNVVVPSEVISQYGIDPLRFYLLHEIPVGRDGDFSWERMDKLYNAKLRNDLGNLLNRAIVLLQKDGGAIAVPASPEDAKRTSEGWKKFTTAMNNFEFHKGIEQVMQLVSTLNVGIDQTKPWMKKGEERKALLSSIAESLRHVALLLIPFIPEAAERMSKQLNVPYANDMLSKDFVIGNRKEWGNQEEWKGVGEPEILFAPITQRNE